MNPNDERYVHALRFRALTRFYDGVLRATLKEERFKELLVAQAAVRPGDRVLDLGCGTGNSGTASRKGQPPELAQLAHQALRELLLVAAA